MDLIQNLRSSDSENMLVHMTENEVEEFSRAQGGVDINQELGGIPQFTKLASMMDNPEVKHALQLAIKGYTESSHEEQNRLQNEMDSYLDEKVGDESLFNPTAQGQPSPEVQELGQMGVDGDTKLVLMPKKLLFFIWNNVPDDFIETNPMTGLPQFALMGGISDIFSTVMNVLGGGLVGYGASKDQQNQDKYRNELRMAHRANELNHARNQERYRQLVGLNTPVWNTPGSYEQANNPRTIDLRTPLKKGGPVEPIRSLPHITRSVYIKGDEPGQDDNVHVDVPRGSRVLDATTVSDIGDGNSEAGATILSDYIKSIPVTAKRGIPLVQCALSAGEYVVTPEVVEYIGRGSMERGHKKFDQFVKKLRSEKKQSVNSIPKKAKSIEYYLGRNLARGA